MFVVGSMCFTESQERASSCTRTGQSPFASEQRAGTARPWRMRLPMAGAARRGEKTRDSGGRVRTFCSALGSESQNGELGLSTPTHTTQGTRRDSHDRLQGDSRRHTQKARPR